MIESLLERGRYARVVAMLPPDDPLACGLRAMHGHDFAVATECLRQAMTDRPQMVGVRVALAAALRRDARYEEALALLDDASCRQGLYERGMCHLALSDGAAALSSFDAALVCDPAFAAAWLGSHGPALEVQGAEAAVERLRRAMACPGVNGKYWGLLSATLWLCGERAAADAVVRQHIGTDPRRRPLVDGVAALAPWMTPQTRLFGLSASVLRYGLSRAAVEGLVLEFGVRRGTSLRHIAKEAGQAVHGFDSFDGLPESWGNAPQGVLRAALPDMPDGVTLHRGWFEQTLPEFLRDHPGPVRFANIDSDLYSSARTVLTALTDRIVPGTVLVFDEMIGNRSWAEDEYRAFCEFVSENPWQWRVLALAPATKQVAVQMMKKVCCSSDGLGV